ncbi:MAG: DinB family protein [Gemmatimonadales bacterium]|nr:DinB family protein [Gemmatimonadales bacterium]
MERQRAALLVQVGALSPAQLRFRPAPDSWCPLDVVEHLVKVEEATLRRVDERPRARGLAQAARASAALAVMAVASRGGARVKAPTRVVLPQGGCDLSELTARWDVIRGTLREVLEGLAPGEASRPLLRHPRAGWLSTAQSLAFMELHVAHHVRQLERIRGAAGYPA